MHLRGIYGLKPRKTVSFAARCTWWPVHILSKYPSHNSTELGFGRLTSQGLLVLGVASLPFPPRWSTRYRVCPRCGGPPFRVAKSSHRAIMEQPPRKHLRAVGLPKVLKQYERKGSHTSFRAACGKAHTFKYGSVALTYRPIVHDVCTTIDGLYAISRSNTKSFDASGCQHV